jgi:hypothetical protein
VSSREEELLAERNRFARELADLRDEHADLRQRFEAFAETCVDHCVDRAAESVAAQQLVERVRQIAAQLKPYVASVGAYADLEIAVKEYAVEVARIEGI